jgi:hypothetical protein
LLADGWIRHTGDECPVDGDVVVEVFLKGGNLGLSSDTSYKTKALAGNLSFNWRHVEGFKPLTHYRIVKKQGVEKLSKHDDFYFIDCVGIVVNSVWHNDRDSNYLFSQGNVFRTKQEAETYKEKVIDVEGKLRMIANDDPVDWGDFHQLKYWFEYDYSDECLSYDYTGVYRTQGIIYLTEAGKDRALKEIGEEALIYMIRNKR